MRLALAAVSLGLAGLAAGPAAAGETQCWLDHGVLVVPAALGDIAGDFILDFSAPKSELHLTVAQEFGVDAPADVATLRLAGETIPAASFEVTNLAARTWGFPTDIAGVIGADVLARYVVDIDFAACRLTLRSRTAPPLPDALTLPIRWLDAVPTLLATASDGHTAITGPFAIDTGSAGVRVSSARASYTRPPAGDDWAWRLDPPARLAGLSFGETVATRVPAALAPDAPPDLIGDLGTNVWSGYAVVRIDLPAGRVQLLPRAR